VTEKKDKPKKSQKTIIIDDDNLKRIYSNFASVSTTPHDCNITFCHIDPLGITPTKVDAKIVTKIAIPNSLVESFINAIETNYKRHLKKQNKVIETKK